MTDRTTLSFTGPARDAALWLLDETGPALTYHGADPLTVTLDDWYEASHDEQAVLDTLRVLSTRSYLLDVKSLAQADSTTRLRCLWAVGMTLGALRVDEPRRLHHAAAVMSEFRVTFGQRYRRERHPTFDKAHPDGWLTIVAPDEHAARDVAIDHLGAAWSFLYVTDELDPAWDEYFPRGEVARIEYLA